MKRRKQKLSLYLSFLFCLAGFCVAPATATTNIDVLLVYDTTATNWVAQHGGTAIFSANAITKLNQAMQNSGVECNFRLAYAGAVNYTHSDLGTDLTDLQAGTGGLSVVSGWRDTYRADVIAMLVDTGSAYGWVGQGYLLTSIKGQPNNAFTVNAIRSVDISHTMTHEIGHNFGCGHSKTQATQPGPNKSLNTYSAGWYFTGSDSVKYHTIMAYNSDGTTTYVDAPLFSTPLLTYKSTTAGDAADGDNARTIRETMGVVAGYRAELGQPTISGLSDSPDPVRQGYQLTLTATGVSDPNGSVTKVEFYRDTNNNGVLDIGVDDLLGNGTQSGSDWTLIRNANWTIGSHRYFARAQDNDGNWSEKVSTMGYVASAAPVQGSYLSIPSSGGYSWDDTHGNGDNDGVIETGEDIQLGVRLQSAVSLDWIIGTLSSSFGYLDISGNELQYPPVSAGGAVWPYGHFRMFLDYTSTYTVPFSLYVTYSYGGQDYYQTFTFTKPFYRQGSKKASFAVVGREIDDSTAVAPYNNGDGIVQSGEKIHIRPKIRNTGQARATSVLAYLAYTGSVFQVNSADVEDYPDLDPSAEDYPTGISSYSIEGIRKDYTGSQYIDVHISYDQSATEVVIPNGIQIDIQPAAWMRLSEKAFDFGIATPGSTVTHTTVVQNTGCASLQITNITTTAADTTWVGPALPWTLAAGQSTNLVLQINTTVLQGQISRQVRVYSTGRVAYPGEDDTLILGGIVSGTVPVYEVPNVSGGNKPDISGDKIVWYDTSSGNSDVYLYNMSTGVKQQITTNTADQYDPFISGNLIVWEDDRNNSGNGNTDVYAYDIAHPELGTFPVVNASPWEERVIGVDGNLVAVLRAYEILYSDGSPVTAWNLIIKEYNGNGGFTERYNSNYTPGSGTEDRQTIINSSGDFGDGFLVYQRQTLYLFVSSSTGRRSWQTRSSYTHAFDFAAGDTAPRNLPLISLSRCSAAAHRFVYAKYSAAGDQEIWLWKTDGTNQRAYGVANQDLADDGVAVGGTDGQDVICYDYRGRDGLYYVDRGNGNLESVLTTLGDCRDFRADGYRLVWVDYAAGQTVKYAYLKQADVQVTSPGITFSQENPVEGTLINISILVRNLTTYNQTGNVTVNLYDGDPDNGGTSLATGQMFSGLAANTDRSVTFSNITSLVEGQHNIFAKLTVSASDPANNNKASRTLNVLDSDTEPPTISTMVAAERNGDGDGIIGSDENIRISWNATDPSGIGSMAVTVDGTNATVQGTYYADIVPLAAGTHTVTITAADADTSPASRQVSFNFEVVSKESIAISFGSSTLSNGSPVAVDLGMFSKDVAPAHSLFIVRNNGEQQLTLGTLSLTGLLTKSGPGSTNVAPSSTTWFELVPNTGTEGVFTGTVAIASSDLVQSPFNFKVRYEVRADTDGDTIPDAWMQLHFGHSTGQSADRSRWNDDADGDGMTNLQEYLAGTDPLDAASALRITSVSPTGTHFVVRFPTVAGKSYDVHWAFDLNSGSWSNLVTGISGTGGTVSVTDSNVLLQPRRFYRIKLVVP